AQAGFLHDVLGVAVVAGEPARQRVGVTEVRQHHIGKTCPFVTHRASTRREAARLSMNDSGTGLFIPGNPWVRRARVLGTIGMGKPSAKTNRGWLPDADDNTICPYPVSAESNSLRQASSVASVARSRSTSSGGSCGGSGGACRAAGPASRM